MWGLTTVAPGGFGKPRADPERTRDAARRPAAARLARPRLVERGRDELQLLALLLGLREADAGRIPLELGALGELARLADLEAVLELARGDLELHVVVE